MSFDVNNFINNFMSKIGKTGGASGNESTKEAEKNMQLGQQQYLNYTETPDEDPQVNKKMMMAKYGIPSDFTLHDEVEEQSVKKYGIPAEQNIAMYAVPKPTDMVNVKYGIAPIVEPTVEPTPTGEQNILMYGVPEEHLIVSDYAVPFEPTPTVEPTPIVEPTPQPTGIAVTMYGHPITTIEPTPQPIVTPQPQPQPQPIVNPSNPWRINVRNIFLNMFGGENSSFAQRVMNVFDNFFSRWR